MNIKFQKALFMLDKGQFEKAEILLQESFEESKSDYEEAKYCLGIIMTLFDCYKGQMDKLMTDLIEFVSIKIKNGKITDKNLIRFLLNLISLCFILSNSIWLPLSLAL